MPKKVAVVLFNLGGPDHLDSVQPFLFNLFNDPAIIRLPNPFRFLLAKLISKRRTPFAQEIYKLIGGKSPLLELTEEQSHALDEHLNTRCGDQDDDLFKSFIVMRYWKPFSSQTVVDVKNFAPDEIVLLPLYPQFSTTTTQSSIKDWRNAAAKAGLDAPHNTVCCYPDDKSLIEAYVALAKPLLEEAFKNHTKVRLLLSAHGLPEKIVTAGDPYPDHVELTSAGVVQGLRDIFPTSDFESTVCYQSRVGPMKWIGPSTEDMISQAGDNGEALVVLPIAFVSEHSETLVELDIEYKELALEKGVPGYYRVPAVGCHPLFIKGLASRVMNIRRGVCPRVCGLDVNECPNKVHGNAL